MQWAAILWHVSLLVAPERKALALGFAGLARIAPVVVFSMVSGVVADAMDRRRVQLITQSLAGVVALVLLISLPSIVIAWLKLRQRNLGPLLDANSWAVNAKAKIMAQRGFYDSWPEDYLQQLFQHRQDPRL